MCCSSMSVLVVPKPEFLYNIDVFSPDGSQHNKFIKFISKVIEEDYSFSKFGVEVGY